MTAKGYGIAWNNPITEGDGNGKIEPALACVFEPTREIQKLSRQGRCIYSVRAKGSPSTFTGECF